MCGTEKKYESKLKDMSDSTLFEEMDSVTLVIDSFSPTSKMMGMASRAQLRYNAVASELLKRKLLTEYNERY